MRPNQVWLALLIFVVSELPAQDNSWPQEISADDGSVVLIYQPQVESFTGNTLEGRAAVAVKMPAADNVPIFGAIWFE